MQSGIHRLLTIVAEHEIHNQLTWDVDLNFYMDCSDLFYWGTADVEPVETTGDVDLLEQCLKEAGDDGAWLYCCKKRLMRPQGAHYGIFEHKNWDLFDSCGPEREVGLGNPFEKGEYNKIPPSHLVSGEGGER